MSRDKYSDDHTIRVSEGSGLLCVEGQLKVVGDVEIQGNTIITGNIPDLAIGNDLVVGNDLIVANDLTVAGNGTITGDLNVGDDVSGDNFIFNSSRRVIRWISVDDLDDGAEVTAVGNDLRVFSSIVGGFKTWLFGHSTDSTWQFDFPLNRHLLNGSNIKSLKFLVEIGALNDGSPSYDFDISIFSYPSLGNSTTITTEDTASISITNLPGFRVWYIVSLDVSNIDIDTVGGQNYFARFEQVDTGACTVLFYGCQVEMEISDLYMGLNQELA